jgi:hypothetical protein
MPIIDNSSDLLNKLIDKDISKRIKNIFNKIELNDEFELSFYNSSNKRSINYENFVKVLKILKIYSKKFKDVKLETKNSLDCLYTDSKNNDVYRLSVNKYKLIKESMSIVFNKRNDVIFKLFLSKFINNNEGFEIIKKHKSRENVLDIIEYDLRIRKYQELIPTDKEINNLKKISKEEIINIIFRYKQRISLILIDNSDVQLRIDLTDVKTSKNIKTIQTQPSNYELEIEFTIKKKNKNDIKYLNRIMNETHRLLRVVQQSNFIINDSTKTKILNNYKKMFSLTDSKLRFIGRQTRSLEIQHVVDMLPNKYAVTDKADGERYILLIFDNSVYLMSTNLDIINTGIVIEKKNNKYNNTILDGELIFIKKYNRYIFMVFDCLYYCNKKITEENDFIKKLKYADDVIDKCFVLESQKGFKFKTYNDKFNMDKILDFHDKELERFINTLNNDILIDKIHLLVRRKYFINVLGGSNNEIFKYSKLMYNKIMYSNDVNMPYNLDGLIYHPLMNLQFVEYKFKPPNQNSIDFYITFERDNETNKILTLYDNSDETLVENKEYRVCNLHVGKVIRNQEYPVLFQQDNKKYLAYLYIKDNEIRDIEGNIILDNTVVEFYYNNDSSIKNDNFRWTPIRTRYDKTESVARNKRKYGNYITTAESVWRSIVNPFTLDNIEELSNDNYYKNSIDKLRKRIDHKLILSERSQNQYYKFQSNIGSLQRSFHNWIKDMLIQTYCSPIDGKKLDVLGISEGRGGDILKFYFAKVNFMLSTDVSSDVIESTTDGWLSRYRKFKSNKKYTNFPKMVSIQADATVKFDYESQKKKLLNMTPNNEKLLKKYFNENKQKFDRVNCQFALHYFLRNEESWNNFTDNINQFLKEDGYAIFTCFDGDVVNSLLKGKNKYEVNYTDKKGVKRTFFSIDKKYNDTDNIGLGFPIEVFISSFMNEGETEYLVSKNFLIKELSEKCNLELVDTNLFSDLYEVNRNYFKNTIYYEDNERTRDFLIKVSKFYDDMDDETAASFKLTKLNRYYVFRKSSTIKNKVKKGGNKFVDEIKKYLGQKYQCKIKQWKTKSYYKSIYNSLLKSNYIEDTGYKTFFKELNIKLSENLDDEKLKKINSLVKIKDNKVKFNGINSIIIEKTEDNKFLISGYGKKNKIIKSNPTLIMYKENNNYYPVYKDCEDRDVYLYNTKGSFIRNILEKYEI